MWTHLTSSRITGFTCITFDSCQFDVLIVDLEQNRAGQKLQLIAVRVGVGLLLQVLHELSILPTVDCSNSSMSYLIK